jgi:hypothetical protein
MAREEIEWLSKTELLLIFLIACFATIMILTPIVGADKLELQSNMNEVDSSFLKENFNPDYGVIQITDTFLGIETDRIAEYSLVENTEQCTTECSAEGRVTLYKDGKLFEDIEFIGINNVQETLSDVQYWILATETYEEEVPDTYKEECKDGDPNYCIQIPDTYKKVESTRDVWQRYDYEELKAGD